MFLSEEELHDLSKIRLRKIVPIAICKKFLEKRLLYMNQVQSWDDRFENFFLKERIHGPNYDINGESIVPFVYGQSWSYGEESNLMWLSYSKDNMSVCIETTVQKLLEACSIGMKDLCALWLGKVQYVSLTGLEAKAKDASNILLRECQSLWNKFFPETLFYKRLEFKEEKEFRVIRIIPSQNECYSQIGAPKRICFNITPSDIFESITVNPFLQESEAKAVIDSISRLCCDSIPISQSKLCSFCPIDIYLK